MEYPIDLATVSRLAEDIAAQTRELAVDDHQTRKNLVRQAHALLLSLELPMETLKRRYWGELAFFPVLRIVIDMRVFEFFPKLGEPPVEVCDLAKSTGTDPDLLSRLLKHLASLGAVEEAGANLYSATRFSAALADPQYYSGVTFLFDLNKQSFQGFPEFFQKNGYKNPTDKSHTPFNVGHKTSLSLFEFLHKHPHIGKAFNEFMPGANVNHLKWVDHVPVKKILLEGASEADNAVLMVDVGGGIGRDLELFHNCHPEAHGRLILQDTESVIQQAKTRSTPFIEANVHDFFTPQPVKGARSYYIHSVLHDWPFQECVQILSHIADAMVPEYSKVLIHENVVLDTGTDWEVTGLDMTLMSNFSGKERTERDWNELLEASGLELVKIWTFDKGAPSIIEAVLKARKSEEEPGEQREALANQKVEEILVSDKLDQKEVIIDIVPSQQSGSTELNQAQPISMLVETKANISSELTTEPSVEAKDISETQPAAEAEQPKKPLEQTLHSNRDLLSNASDETQPILSVPAVSSPDCKVLEIPQLETSTNATEPPVSTTTPAMREQQLPASEPIKSIETIETSGASEAPEAEEASEDKKGEGPLAAPQVEAVAMPHPPAPQDEQPAPQTQQLQEGHVVQSTQELQSQSHSSSSSSELRQSPYLPQQPGATTFHEDQAFQDRPFHSSQVLR